MPLDQAAGLRRRGVAQPVVCVTCFFDTASSAERLACAFHQLGQRVLLVDVRGRQFAVAPTRSLFGWAHQLAHKQLNVLPQAYGDGWYAPGLQFDVPGFAEGITGYDFVILDAGQIEQALTLPQGVQNTCIVGMSADRESTLRAYRLLKTLSHADNSMDIFLLGEAAICDNVLAAGRHFLEQQFIRRVHSMAREDDAYAALAVRMAHEETHRMVRSE
ncbi:MAG: hypothetical protein IV085_04690 [Thiobacillus sp.]|nr:hypothetical protein [Thiobacillus sp.]